jgi:hypothetical protein
MAPYEERVIVEERELRFMLERLDAFISSDKFMSVEDEEDRTLLLRQAEAMRLYLDILGQRIARF